jgi:hypothetical protein
MKKVIAFVAFAAALAAFSSFPQPGVSHQAAADPTEMLALKPAPKSLKTEAYDAI